MKKREFKSGIIFLVFMILLSTIISINGNTVNAEEVKVYFVSSTDGNDLNDGLSEASPWKTLDKVNSMQNISGATIRFKRGDCWRGTLKPVSGIEGLPTIYTSYGSETLEKPIIYGSVEANNPSDWIDEGNNLWSYTSKKVELSGNYIKNYDFETDKNNWYSYGNNANIETVRDTTEGYTGNCSLKITTGENIGTNSYDMQVWTSRLSLKKDVMYEFKFWAKASQSFSVTSGGISIIQTVSPYANYGVSKQGNYYPSFGIDWKEYKMSFISNSDADDARIGISLGGLMPPNTTLNIDNVSLKECRDSFAYKDIGNIIFNSGDVCRINNDYECGIKKSSIQDLNSQNDFYSDNKNNRVIVYSTENPAISYSDIEIAVNRYIIDQTEKSYIKYEGLKLLYGGAHGIGGANANNITVKYCEIGYIGGGYNGIDKNGKPIRFGNGIEFWENTHDDYIEDNTIYQVYDAAVTNQGCSENVKHNNIFYRRNVIDNCEYSYEFWLPKSTEAMTNIVFEYNICTNAGYGWGHAQRPDSTGKHICVFTNACTKSAIEINNNTFDKAACSLLYFHNVNELAGISFDNNKYTQQEGGTLLRDHVPYIIKIEDFALYVTKTAWDKNSTFNGNIVAK